MKITNVVETCMRDRRDVIREQKMRIKNETKIVSSRRDRVNITENKSRTVECGFYLTEA